MLKIAFKWKLKYDVLSIFLSLEKLLMNLWEMRFSGGFEGTQGEGGRT